MKQASVLDRIVWTGSSNHVSTKVVASVFLAVLVTAFLAFGISMVVSAGKLSTESRLASRDFLAANPEMRYATHKVNANFITANPEIKYLHFITASAPKTAARDFLAINPEMRYALHQSEPSSMNVNPETRYTQREAMIWVSTPKRASLATNPELKYASYSMIETSNNGNSVFFEANPEVLCHLRTLDGGKSK